MSIETYKMDFGGVHGGTWTQISMHFQGETSGAGPSFEVAANLNNDFVADQLTDYRAMFPSSYGLHWIRTRRRIANQGNSRTHEFGLGGATGTRAGTTDSLALSPVVKLYPGITNNTQGRIFLPCVGVGDYTENVFDGGYTSIVVAFFGGLVGWTGSVSGVEWSLAIFSPKLGTAVPVVAVSVADVIGNMKRRRIPH